MTPTRVWRFEGQPRALRFAVNVNETPSTDDRVALRIGVSSGAPIELAPPVPISTVLNRPCCIPFTDFMWLEVVAPAYAEVTAEYGTAPDAISGACAPPTPKIDGRPFVRGVRDAVREILNSSGRRDPADCDDLSAAMVPPKIPVTPKPTSTPLDFIDTWNKQPFAAIEAAAVAGVSKKFRRIADDVVGNVYGKPSFYVIREYAVPLRIALARLLKVCQERRGSSAVANEALLAPDFGPSGVQPLDADDMAVLVLAAFSTLAGKHPDYKRARLVGLIPPGRSHPTHVVVEVDTPDGPLLADGTRDLPLGDPGIVPKGYDVVRPARR